MNEEGLHDSAILLLALGEEAAAEVFKHLTPKEVHRLGTVMAGIRSTSFDRLAKVLERFRTDSGSVNSLVDDSGAYVKSVLRKALGNDRADLLIDRIGQGEQAAGIEHLKWMDARSVAELIGHEHPQIVASILAYLDRDQAAAVLALFEDTLRHDLLFRIATLDGIQPAALRELDDVLNRIVAGGSSRRPPPMGGSKAAAEILNLMGGTSEAGVLDAIRTQDPDLAQQIADLMFTFDDLADLDNRSMQTLLREVQTDSLVVALKGADPALREQVFRNMSQRAAEALRDDLESKGPVKISAVEAEQKAILQIARRLADEGSISIGGAGSDAIL